jgi:transposase
MKIVVKACEELAREEAAASGSERAAKGKYVVRLTEEERAGLEELTRRGRVAAATVKHAGILLKAAEGPGGPAWPDRQIREAYGVSWSTIARVRQKLVEDGLAAALSRKTAVRPPTLKVDGEMEARLIALACSAPPEGEARWTLRLLADKMVELEYVEYAETLSYETVRRVLKKTTSSRGRRKSG